MNQEEDCFREGYWSDKWLQTTKISIIKEKLQKSEEQN